MTKFAAGYGEDNLEMDKLNAGMVPFFHGTRLKFNIPTYFIESYSLSWTLRTLFRLSGDNSFSTESINRLIANGFSK